MWGKLVYGYCRLFDFRVLFLAFQRDQVMQMAEPEKFKISIKGTGLSFDQSIEKEAATKIMSFVLTGSALASGGGPGSGGADGPGASGDGLKQPPVKGSLASFIKAKRGDKNQNNRFLATAYWLSGRSSEPVTAKAVAKALADHNQKRLANPPDCLNQNVRKGLCEKRPDGSFFITPEGLEALEGPPTE